MERPKDLVCDFKNCGKVFAKLRKLIEHKNRHLYPKSHKCTFEGCTAAYSRRQHLKRHIDTIHSSETKKEYKCVEVGCLATFDTLFCLSQHRNRAHPSIEKVMLQCPFCDSSFTKEWQLLEHKTIHTGAKHFCCSQCDGVFETAIQLRVHNKESGHRPPRKPRQTIVKSRPLIHKCRNCTEAFGCRNDLRKHTKIAHKASFICDECQEVYLTAKLLKDHKTTVHAENNTTEFKCHYPECPRIYSHKKNLLNHIRISHEGKRYGCDDCGKELASKQKLKEHMFAIHGPGKKTVLPRPKKSNQALRKRLEDQLSGCTPIVSLTEKRKPLNRTKHITNIMSAKESTSAD